MTTDVAMKRVGRIIEANEDPSDTLYGCLDPDDIEALRLVVSEADTQRSTAQAYASLHGTTYDTRVKRACGLRG